MTYPPEPANSDPHQQPPQPGYYWNPVAPPQPPRRGPTPLMIWIIAISATLFLAIALVMMFTGDRDQAAI